MVAHTKELFYIKYMHYLFFQNNCKFGTIIIPILLMGTIRKVKQLAQVTQLLMVESRMKPGILVPESLSYPFAMPLVLKSKKCTVMSLCKRRCFTYSVLENFIFKSVLGLTLLHGILGLNRFCVILEDTT